MNPGSTHDCSTHGNGSIIRDIERTFFSILLVGLVLMAGGFAAQLAGSAAPTDSDTLACVTPVCALKG